MTFWTRSIARRRHPRYTLLLRRLSFFLIPLFYLHLPLSLYVSGLSSLANMSEVPPDSSTHLEPPNITTEREDSGAEDSGMFALSNLNGSISKY